MSVEIISFSADAPNKYARSWLDPEECIFYSGKRKITLVGCNSEGAAVARSIKIPSEALGEESVLNDLLLEGWQKFYESMCRGDEANPRLDIPGGMINETFIEEDGSEKVIVIRTLGDTAIKPKMN